MCILLLSTAHPSYPLILLSNRDEFLTRPTAVADWWSSDASNHDTGIQILSGRDLRHPSHGTWLGITRTGRIACLTNFREESEDSNSGDSHASSSSNDSTDGLQIRTKRDPHPVAQSKPPAPSPARSRGEITKAYLSSTLPPEEWVAEFLDEAHRGKWGDMGGFSLFFGSVTMPTTKGTDQNEAPIVQLGVLSNRSKSAGDVIWLAGGSDAQRQVADGDGEEERGDVNDEARGTGKGKDTHGFTCSLSNSHFGDTAWPKVIAGEALLSSLIASPHFCPSTPPDSTTTEPHSTQDSERDDFLNPFFSILSTDIMPARRDDETWTEYSRQLRKSILIPPIQAGDTKYGTQKQTVVMVGRRGDVLFEERTLFDGRGERIEADRGTKRVQFMLDTCVEGTYAVLCCGVE